MQLPHTCQAGALARSGNVHILVPLLHHRTPAPIHAPLPPGCSSSPAHLDHHLQRLNHLCRSWAAQRVRIPHLHMDKVNTSTHTAHTDTHFVPLNTFMGISGASAGQAHAQQSSRQARRVLEPEPALITHAISHDPTSTTRGNHPNPTQRPRPPARSAPSTAPGSGPASACPEADACPVEVARRFDEIPPLSHTPCATCWRV